MSVPRESKRPPAASGKPSDGGVATPPLSPGLWLVPTPIGNVRDITLRALDVLGAADILACEDTRRTRQLLDLHGVPVGGRTMVSYHDQNGAARRPQIMAWLAEGRSVAYATDAGTPLIADPGYRLVSEARDAGHAVHALPGASSVLTALCTSGLPTDRFLFVGFLPPKASARQRVLEEVGKVPASLVFFESPRRVVASLAAMAGTLGRDRPAVLARELTKRFEEVSAGSLGELADTLAEAGPPKGEIVIVVGPPGAAAAADPEDITEALRTALAGHSTKEAARMVADSLGLPRREVYARALEIKDE